MYVLHYLKTLKAYRKKMLSKLIDKMTYTME